MNELIPITEMDGTQLINARDLHGFLQVGRDFSNWIKDRSEKHGFIEDEDFFKHENLADKNQQRNFPRILGKIRMRIFRQIWRKPLQMGKFKNLARQIW